MDYDRENWEPLARAVLKEMLKRGLIERASNGTYTLTGEAQVQGDRKLTRSRARLATLKVQLRIQQEKGDLTNTEVGELQDELAELQDELAELVVDGELDEMLSDCKGSFIIWLQLIVLRRCAWPLCSVWCAHIYVQIRQEKKRQEGSAFLCSTKPNQGQACT